MPLRWLFILLLLFRATVSADDAPCFETGVDIETSTCENYVNAIADDSRALRSLGRRLEIADRYEQAVTMYRRALKHHRTDITLQQGLIRARSELRARALLTGFETPQDASATSGCWTLRWMEAVDACSAEIGHDNSNWALYERYGDVLRSVGRPMAAVQAYRTSLQLNTGNARLRTKYATLTGLVDLEKSDLESVVSQSLPNPAIASAPPVSQVRPAVDVNTGRYRAIVIGNQNYQVFDDLESPHADARAISEVLSSNYGFDVTTLIDASRYELFEVLSNLRRTSSNYDSVLIYYAGHGFLDEVTKRGYWLPVDAEEDNAANWISTGDITNLVAGLESRHALVIADSCFSGALTRSVNIESPDGRESLLQRLSAQRSRSILTSGGLEPVLDGGNPGSRHSVFADALIDALRQNTGVVEAGRLFVTVRDRVSLASDQTPQFAPLRNAGHEGGDFIFRRR